MYSSMDITILGFKFRLEVLILIVIAYLILTGHLIWSCCRWEGFSGANTNHGESSDFNQPAVNTTNWGAPSLVVTPGQPLGKGVQNILNRVAQPVPLPEGELDMFATTPFKPECCPNAYSNSTGCACMTTKQYNYLIARGGNNVPYSEY